MKQTLLTSLLALLTAAAFAADPEKHATQHSKSNKSAKSTATPAPQKPAAKSDPDPTADATSKAAAQANDDANKLRESVDQTLQKKPEPKAVTPAPITPTPGSAR